MKKFLSHFSALDYWDLPLAKGYFRKEIERVGMNEYTVLNGGKRFQQNGVIAHVQKSEIPEGGVINNKGILVATPELVFVQLAKYLDIHQTIILADAICGLPNGPYSTAITSPDKLLNFATKAVGVHGRKNALKALQYVKANACSILEIFVELLIGLPMYLGGLNIRNGVFNYNVVLSPEIADAFSKTAYFVDYCFPDIKIGYEYQGGHHDKSTDEDNCRNLALKRMGFKIIYITKSIFYNSKRLEHFLLQTHKDLGVKRRVRTDKYYKGCQRIFSLLPGKIINK